MKITLRAHGWVRSLLKSSALELSLPDGSRLSDCLDQLAAAGPDERLANIWDRAAGRFRVPIFVMINEREVQDFSFCLQEGQVVSLVAPMAGG